MYFDFYKGRLLKAAITYDRSVRWENAREFAAALSGPWKLPAGAWKFDKLFGGEIVCSEFAISIDAWSNSVVLTDTVAKAAMEDEARQKEEDRKKAFKP